MSESIGHLDFDTLNDLLDGELVDGEAEARLHLVECDDCAAAFNALTEAVAALGALQVEARPARDLWSGIEARIAPEATRVIPLPVESRHQAPRRRTIAVPVPLAWAAGFALAALSGTTAWMAMDAPPELSDEAFLAGAPVASGQATFAGSDGDGQGYDLAIDDLEQVLELARRELEPETVRTLEASLAEIDQALAEAEDALMQDPGNAVIYRLIAAHERTRYRLLSQTALLLPQG